MILNLVLYVGPSALSVSTTKNVTNSSVVVQWDEVEDYLLTTTYTVTWTSERDPSNIQSATLTEQSSYTITGLTLDTVYTITVTAANECGQGPEFVTSIIISTGMYICMFVQVYASLYACTYYAYPLFICMYHIPPAITAIVNPVQSMKYTRTKSAQTHVSTRYNLF